MAATTVTPAQLAGLQHARAVQARDRELRELREEGTCPATRHRHSVRGWEQDGCRCPSTVALYEKRRDAARAARARRAREAGAGQVDLRLADRRDAEALAVGYRLPRVSRHTRALAVRLMREADPDMTDRQVAWRLTTGGQGRTVTKRTGEQVFEPVSVRQVQRIQTTLDWKRPRRPGESATRPERAR